MSNRTTLIIGVVTLLAAGGAGLWFGNHYFGGSAPAESQDGQSPEPVRHAADFIAARVYGQPRQLTDFALHDGAGQPFGREQIRGEWHLVFFGFTNCPDICPTTMATLAELHRAMAAHQGPVPSVLFVSVDPERDDGEAMARYASGFNPEFKAATGPHAQLQALTLQMGAPYLNNRPPADAHAEHMNHGAPQVDHSAAVFLTDPEARLIASFPPPLSIEAMVADLKALIDG